MCPLRSVCPRDRDICVERGIYASMSVPGDVLDADEGRRVDETSQSRLFPYRVEGENALSITTCTDSHSLLCRPVLCVQWWYMCRVCVCPYHYVLFMCLRTYSYSLARTHTKHTHIYTGYIQQRTDTQAKGRSCSSSLCFSASVRARLK